MIARKVTPAEARAAYCKASGLREAGALLGVSYETVRRALHAGKVPVRVGGRHKPPSHLKLAEARRARKAGASWPAVARILHVHQNTAALWLGKGGRYAR